LRHLKLGFLDQPVQIGLGNRQALAATLDKRPDLLSEARLSADERRELESLLAERSAESPG
jgi:hypothetical protein